MTVDPAIERLYNARAAIPDHPEIFARWAKTSAAARERLGGNLDLAYGEDADARLDLFAAESAGAPLHAFIHGGYWKSLDKSDFSFLAGPLVEAGVSVAVLNYGLCPRLTIDGIVGQMRASLAWLWRRAAGFGADRERITVSGHSAGGHLVAMLMATDWPALGSDLPADLVKGGVAISGLFDLDPLRLTSMNADIGLDRDAARRNSPLFLSPATGAPLVLAVGGDESAAFHEQSDRLAEAWGGRGIAVSRLDLPGRHHLSAVEALGEPDSPLFSATLALARGEAALRRPGGAG